MSEVAFAELIFCPSSLFLSSFRSLWSVPVVVILTIWLPEKHRKGKNKAQVKVQVYVELSYTTILININIINMLLAQR